MKTKLYILMTMVLILITSCSSNPMKKEARLNVQKIEMVSKLSHGVGYSLDKTNISSAKILNNNIQDVVGRAPITEQKNVEKQVDTTNFVTIVKEIVKIERIENELNKEYQKAAEELPKIKEELDQHKRWFGLYGVYLGLKRFGYWMLGLGIVFILSRILSSANPIASAIFSIFESLGMMVINAIKWIVPKSLSLVKSSAETVATKLVDVIEYNNLLTPEIKSELSNKMTDEEKQLVKSVKKNLNYTK